MLSVGTRLGPYEIVAPIGAGGMGEVYRARDTKLNRDVALKILPEAFAGDPERLARFTREAQTLAAFNHPHIAQIYGLEDLGAGGSALVMELVEGETLDARLKARATESTVARGFSRSEPGLPFDEAMAIARQIADALDAAHGQGIIHRDLKPANVMVRLDGTVKVLDFGLAKAMDPLSSSAAVALANSPTITSPAALTGAGVILGTAAYMSPEQARGKAVDKRSDLWAFGAVLFEMLTGTRAFRGDDVADTVASVIAKEPDWTRLSAETPAAIRRLLRRCLEKDRNRRLSDAADARLEVDDALTSPSGNATLEGLASPQRRRTWSWAVAGGFGLGLGATLVLMLLAPGRRVPPPASMRLSAELGADAALASSVFGTAMTLSPDGAVVAFVSQKIAGGSPQLYVRRLNQLQATPLSGTDDAESPFFSPDGQWIAFFAGGRLKKIAVTGGAAVTLGDAPNGRGGAWGEDGTIVFTPDSGSGVGLLRVSSAGGTPAPVTSLAEGEVTQRWPQVLPGGKAVLFTSSRTIGIYNDANLVVQPLPSGARKVVQRGGYHGRYLPSGHLVYINDGTLFAAPFDLDRLAVTGQPVPALEGVTSNASTGGAQFAMSASGTLVYLPGQSTSAGLPIHWMDHEGNATPLRATPATWFNPRFAPDGRRLALQFFEGQSDIWVYEWARDTLTRLTFDTASVRPVWTPDSRRIVFASQRADKSTLNLYWQRADGTGDAQRLTESKNPQRPASWHPNGKFLAFDQQTPQTSWDLMILPLEGDEAAGWKAGKPAVFLNTPSAESEPMFSPDGRWLAYQSNESGRNEVYVRPFPDPGGQWQISTGGGSSPTWSRTKHELFYGTTNGQIMVAAFTVEGDSFRAEKPRSWSDGRFVVRGLNRMFDLHPDGERFALTAQTQMGTKQDKLVFIFNFFDDLRRIAPGAK
jgi:serine/threonine-protein kinase